MKQLQKYRVKRAYGMYRVGDIIQPTGMTRDELKTNGFIEKYVDAPAVAPEPEPEPLDDVLVETAVLPATTADLPRGRRGRYGR